MKSLDRIESEQLLNRVCFTEKAMAIAANDERRNHAAPVEWTPVEWGAVDPEELTDLWTLPLKTKGLCPECGIHVRRIVCR